MDKMFGLTDQQKQRNDQSNIPTQPKHRALFFYLIKLVPHKAPGRVNISTFFQRVNFTYNFRHINKYYIWQSFML